MGRRFVSPSPALVVSVIALVVALGGTGYAASQQPGFSVQSAKKRKAKPKVLRGPSGERGPAGPAGATGPSGATGPIGQTGAAGPAGSSGKDGAAGHDGSNGATSVVVRTHTIPITAGGDASGGAGCIGAERATGGGVKTNYPTNTVYHSDPSDSGLGGAVGDGVTPTGWYAYVRNTGGSAGNIIVYVVCAAP